MPTPQELIDDYSAWLATGPTESHLLMGAFSKAIADSVAGISGTGGSGPAGDTEATTTFYSTTTSRLETIESAIGVLQGNVKASVGTPIELLNANTGGSGNNRTFTVPADKIWQIQSFRVTYVSSATAGTRGLRVTYETSSGVPLCSQRAGVSQSASQTREYAFAAGAPYDTAFGGVSSDYLLVPLPPLLLKAGHVIRLRDPANVSTADTFTINGLAIEWSIA